MKTNKKVLMMGNHFVVDDAKLTDECAKLAADLINPAHTLYEQYQPQLLAEIIRVLKTAKTQADFNDIMKMCIGCGGGKSNIFLLALLIAIKLKYVKKSLITAPSKLLLLQYKDDLSEMISFGRASGVLPQSFCVRILEISSNEKPKKAKVDEMTDDELLSPEYVESIPEMQQYIKEREAEQQEREAEQHSINYDVVPRTNVRRIKEELDSDEIVVVFACKPSAIEFAKNILKKYSHRVFDYVIHDEVHYWQGAVLKSPAKDAIRIIAEHAKVVLNVTATFKQTDPIYFNHDDPLLGRTVADIPTVALKEWGIIKQKLVLRIIKVPQKFRLTDGEKEILANNKIDARQFYKEWAVLIQVLRDQLEVANKTGKYPHIIDAGSSVPINQQLVAEGCNFKNSVEQIIPNTLLSEINGGTKRIIRDEKDQNIKAATSAQASLTIQHSCYTAGVNITNFNVAVLLREMCEITLNQFINRVTRKHPDYDTAYVYYAVEENELAKDRLTRFFNRLWNIGLMIGDIDIEVLEFAGKGTEPPRKSIIKDGILTEHNATGIVEDVVFDLIGKEQEVIEENRLDALSDEEFVKEFSKI